MPGVNKVFLLGRITTTPEYQLSKDGKPILNLCLLTVEDLIKQGQQLLINSYKHQGKPMTFLGEDC